MNQARAGMDAFVHTMDYMVDTTCYVVRTRMHGISRTINHMYNHRTMAVVYGTTKRWRFYAMCMRRSAAPAEVMVHNNRFNVQSVAERMQMVIRRADVFCRYGTRGTRAAHNAGQHIVIDTDHGVELTGGKL